MPSNNTKYSQEMRTQTAEYIIQNGKSATSMAEELGIDTNTVCRWVRDYRRQHNLPSYAEEKGIGTNKIHKHSEGRQRIKQLERELKKSQKALQDEKEKVEILKKSLHIFMQPHE